ncbi:MAG: ABC transporter ATP-binding protein [Alphaproteobacteria bacterium]|nr:ABC transporter ATP-binding protein [Alphaproteobacteria bacterium]
MLKVKNVSKVFAGKTVLETVSFELKPGGVVALLGENGAGKSTLMRIMSGFFEPETGTVELDELNLQKNRLEFLKKIAYVQETSSLYGDMCVYDFLRFASALRGLETEESEKRIKELVKILDLQAVLLQTAETLSKGFKKRVELAATLIGGPEVLLLDEPSEGLDPNQKSILRTIIKEYAKEHIVVISTHTLEDVEALASEVLLLHKGKLKINTSLEEFKTGAGDDLLASFRKITLD